MNLFPEILEKRLEDLARIGCSRKLTHRLGLDFSSNDYLGFSVDPVLRARILEELNGEFKDELQGDFKGESKGAANRLPIGSSASRLLRGQLEIFEETEAELAEFCGRETALLFPSGYQANVGLLSSLLRPGDCVFSDQANHASIIDGIRLSGAQKEVYPHLDYRALRKLLEKKSEGNSSQSGLKLIVTESIYGMDGDMAPLQELAGLAEEFQAYLVVDEAHATGLWGDFEKNRGGGCVQALGLSEKVLATVHPAGKAMGGGGAWICGSSSLKRYLVNCSRSVIFSTAPIPALAVTLKNSARYWKEVGRERALKVRASSQFLQERLEEVGSSNFKVLRGESPIIPIVIGDNQAALEISEVLQKNGFDIRAIRPPTVPEGTARLRVTVNFEQRREDQLRFVATLANHKSKDKIFENCEN